MHVSYTSENLPEDPKDVLVGTRKWRYTIMYLASEAENDTDGGFEINPVYSLDD